MAGGAVPTAGTSSNKGVFHKHNLRATLFCTVFVFGAILYGYDGTYFTGILAMNKFKLDFGTRQPDGSYTISSAYQSLFASIVQVGEVIGSLSAGFIGDRRGRKGAMVACVILVTFGAVLQLILTGSIALLVLGRAILGIGVGIVSNCTTLYLAEIPPAVIRGTMVSSWQLFLAIGQVIGAGVAQGTKDYTTSFSYRFPIALNILICLIITGGLFFVPESPRWLLSQNRNEDAYRALLRVHKGNDEIDIRAEMKVILDAKHAEAEQSGSVSRWRDIFSGVEKRKFLGAFGILVCQQIGGVQSVISYGTVFFESIGITNAFLVTMITDIVEVFGVLCSFMVVNRIGRRPLLLSTTVLMAIVLLICGGLGTIPAESRSKSVNSAIASMIIIYVFIFNLAWGPLAWVVATELASGKNRTKIMGISTAAFWVSAWAVTFTLPYLYNSEPGSAGLGPMVGFIYGGGTIIAFIFVYFYIPETLGRSLEEINMMMELRVPTRAWSQYQAGVLDKHGRPVPLEQHVAASKAGQTEFVEHTDANSQPSRA
ncbi:related to HXT1-Low-affinity hexose facilitator [Armillaria ostoyae]|uniref:Related to HXT1-Low-affinity hexose facilitator n=1 Tax=Armillaria ostoyae TaxID=47428 RepID=A0A284RKF4_ARMOS|nr:related to HXT1-Low-affinity hexose facilitator [Armillaria ostoyae]